MKRTKTPAASARTAEAKPPRERRAHERVGLPATAFAIDIDGNDLGRVGEISGGGLLLDPASPWARLALSKGQQLSALIVEPTTGNKTVVQVEVRHISNRSIGLRFL